jgi:Predicted periplasmic lipoprotein (DUF2279)
VAERPIGTPMVKGSLRGLTLARVLLVGLPVGLGWSLPVSAQPLLDRADLGAVALSATGPSADIAAADHTAPQPDRAPLPARVEAPENALPEPYSLRHLGRQTKSVGWELAGVTAAVTATRVKDFTKGGASFRFRNEGWFGRNTKSLGMDKMHHAWKTYVLTDVFQSMIERRTGDAKSAAISGAVIGLGVMTYAEVLDGFTARTGFSNEDMAVHVAGAGLSMIRNAVPGMRGKIDYRMEVQPEGFGKALQLDEQLAQRKYLVAVQLSGFRRYEQSPLRFAELHFGYFGRGFTADEKARGEPLRRRLYAGIGFNVQQLFARKPKSRVEKLAKGVLDYVQLPYTSLHR